MMTAVYRVDGIKRYQRLTREYFR